MQTLRLIFLSISCLLLSSHLRAQFDQTPTVVNTCNAQNVSFCAGGSPQLVSQFIADDIFSDTISIGFNFPFFGNNYNSCIISPNNFISFDLGFANLQSLFYYSGALAQGQVDNAILFPFQDLDITQGGNIRYTTVGVAPNRRFVVEFCKVPFFFCAAGEAQNQLVLHEGTGIIDMFIKQNSCTTGWGGGGSSPVIQGLRGNGANIFVSGRGPTNPAWTVTTSEGKRFSPSGGTYAISNIPYNPIPLLFPTQGNFEWYAGDNPQVLANANCLQVNHHPSISYYRVKYTGNVGCDSLPNTVWDTVYMNYQPQFSYDTLTICESMLPYTWQGITLPANTSTQYNFDTIYMGSIANCDHWKILSVVVQPLLTPNFTINPIFCAQGTNSPLPLVSNNGIGGTWSPAFSSQTNNTYTFTPNSSFCATTASVAIQVATPIVPTFSIPTTICAGSTNPLPASSDNGIPGSWSPAFNPNATGTYTFTPSAGECASPVTVTINVEALVTPSFNAVPAICSGSLIAPLPLTSTNGITGTWSPAVNNTATTTYTFTPNAGVCANSTTLTVIVNSPTTVPTFNPVGAICEGGMLAPLPTQSLNGIVGTWSPSLNNQATTTYTFTPASPQCGSTTTMNIVVQPNTVPSFFNVDTMCAGATSFPFGNVSSNGIVGTWSPAFNNTLTTSYTFTPSPGQCSENITRSIAIKPIVTPSFDPFTPICYGEVVAPFPTTSQNGINGVWTPVVNNTNTTTYTFTPDNTNPYSCAASVSQVLVVNQLIIPTFNLPSILCVGNLGLHTLPTVSNNGIYGTWNPSILDAGVSTYTFTPNPGQCATQYIYNVNFNNSNTVPQFTQIAPICHGASTAPQLPLVSLNGIEGTWSPAQIATNTLGATTYTFTPNNLTCGQVTTMSVQIVGQIVPLFDSIVPQCENSANPLLNTSLNGIVGTWTPAFDAFNTNTYTFTPNGGQCASAIQKVVTIIPKVNPSFNLPTSVCQNGIVAAFPTTSNNGITGTWSPSVNTNQTTTYTFTPDGQQCAHTATHTLTVDMPIASTFNSITPMCSGTSLNPLPGQSNEGTAGTWSPVFDNQVSQTYTFTPVAGSCAQNGTVVVQILDNTSIPTFDAYGPYCTGAAIPALPTQSLNGITGTWSPAVQNQTTQTYTFTPSQCGQTVTMTIVIDSVVTPTFTQLAPICQGAIAAPLPTVSNNNVPGTWSPSINNNVTTTYTFTPALGSCGTTTSMTVIVDTPVQPIFVIDDSICFGSTNNLSLASVSTNNIPGVWTPATINNTQTTSYQFQPNAGVCALDTQVTVVVDTLIIPTFVQIMPHCLNWPVASLPLSSLEGVTGTWTPAVNNQQTTTYTFLPSAAQCAVDTVTMQIEIHPVVTPTFAQVGPICIGTALSPLPTISNNGIKGSWAPAINNQQTTTYTFYPLLGQCADTVQMTIVVDTLTLPQFSPIAPICSGVNLNPLPTTSLNGVTGTWSPAMNNMATTTYTFTPTTGQCAANATLEITVNPSINPAFDSYGPYCWGSIVPDLPTTSNNGVTGTWDAPINNQQTGTYTFTPNGAIPCVSVYAFTVVIDPLQVDYQDIIICEGQSYSFGGNTYYSSVTGVADTIATISGCDSVRILNLTVVPPTYGVDQKFICEGDSYTFNGVVYYSNNFTALDTLVSSMGCDSIVTLNLTVVPVNPSMETISLAGCGQVIYKANSFHSDTIFVDTLYSQLGCDSVYKTVVIDVYPVYDHKETVAIFGCNEAYYNGTAFKESQQLIETERSIYGCDSFVRTINIEVHQFNLLASIEPEMPYAGELFEIKTADEFNGSYAITDWFPKSIFSNQTAISQRLQLNTPVAIMVVGVSNTCKDTAMVDVGELPPYSGDVIMPTAFTPNGDGKNDVFKPVFRVERGYTLSEFRIFNRYGQAVYYTSNVNAGWDGTYKGQLQDQGVYYYIIKIRFIDGTERAFKGDVTLIK
jgi:gliding motility-associated-like protein